MPVAPAGIPACGHRWYKSGMDISHYLHRVARGKNGAEHLERREAAEVLSALFAPAADELQLGAFLIAQRMKGETSPELAGFVDAARDYIAGFGEYVAPAGAVDLPCYAGKRRASPVFLAAALKARDAGIPVLIHGLEAIEGRLSAWQTLHKAGVRRAATLSEAVDLLLGEGLVYIDVAELCPPLHTLLHLRPRLGVRSFANTVARLLNPLRCDGQLNGVFHTPYVQRMAHTNTLLGQTCSLLFMGAEGEPELYADRQKLLAVQRQNGVSWYGYPEAGCDAYPRQSSVPPEALLHRFADLLEGRMDAREETVMSRMCEAFAFAAGSDLPTTWEMREEVQATAAMAGSEEV